MPAAAALTVIVQIVCAWCRQPMSGRSPCPPGARAVVSHGLCGVCAGLSPAQRDALAALAKDERLPPED